MSVGADGPCYEAGFWSFGGLLYNGTMIDSGLRLDSDLAFCDDGPMTFPTDLPVLFVVFTYSLLGLIVGLLIVCIIRLRQLITTLKQGQESSEKISYKTVVVYNELAEAMTYLTETVDKLRLTSRARIRDMTGGNLPPTPMDPQDDPHTGAPTPSNHALSRMGRATSSRRVVVGGEEDSDQARRLQQSLPSSSTSSDDSPS